MMPQKRNKRKKRKKNEKKKKTFASPAALNQSSAKRKLVADLRVFSRDWR